jgi:sulfur carrier protein
MELQGIPCTFIFCVKRGETVVTVNGESVQADGMVLSDYLAQEGYRVDVIVIERNGEMLPKGDYKNVILQSGDVIEIVSFMGGG